MGIRKYNVIRYFIAWLLFAALLPVIVLTISWCVEKFLYNECNSFSMVFGSGDLMLIGALLLLGLWLDVQFDDTNINLGIFVAVSEIFFLFFGLVAMIGYGFVKSYSIGKTGADDWMHSLGILSWAFVLYALVHSFCAKLRIVYLKRPVEEGGV